MQDDSIYCTSIALSAKTTDNVDFRCGKVLMFDSDLFPVVYLFLPSEMMVTGSENGKKVLH